MNEKTDERLENLATSLQTQLQDLRQEIDKLETEALRKIEAIRDETLLEALEELTASFTGLVGRLAAIEVRLATIEANTREED